MRTLYYLLLTFGVASCSTNHTYFESKTVAKISKDDLFRRTFYRKEMQSKAVSQFYSKDKGGMLSNSEEAELWIRCFDEEFLSFLASRKTRGTELFSIVEMGATMSEAKEMMKVLGNQRVKEALPKGLADDLLKVSWRSASQSSSVGQFMFGPDVNYGQAPEVSQVYYVYLEDDKSLLLRLGEQQCEFCLYDDSKEHQFKWGIMFTVDRGILTDGSLKAIKRSFDCKLLDYDRDRVHINPKEGQQKD